MHTIRPIRDLFIKIRWEKVCALWLLSLAALVVRIISLFFWRTPRKKSILIVEPFGMGDVISLIPLIESLHINGYKTFLAAKPEWKDLFESATCPEWMGAPLPWAVYDKENKYKLTPYFGRQLWRFVTTLRQKTSGSIGLDPRGDVRSIILLYLAGCERVITLDRYLGTTAKIPLWLGSRVSSGTSLRRWQIACRMLPAVDSTLAISTSPPAIQKLPTKLGRPIRIGLLPAAPWSGRLWQTSKWQQLSKRLGEKGFNLLGVCGPGQSQYSNECLPNVKVIQVTSIDDWIAALSRVDIVVTLDSGPMHLADALGIPIVALFGPGQLPMWAPSGQNAFVVHHQDCPDFSPCHQVPGNEIFGSLYMNKIECQEVENAVDAITVSIDKQHGQNQER